MRVTILNVTIETKPTKTGSYQVADVAYKNNSFQDKVEGKKVMSFGATAEAFKVLATAQSGDVFEVEVKKNDKGYNDWLSMSKAGPGQAGGMVGSVPEGVSQNVQRGSQQTRSTYETPEERAKKQVYIVRQSAINAAISSLSVGAKSPPKVSDIIDLASTFERHVFNETPLGGDTGFDDIPDDPIIE